MRQGSFRSSRFGPKNSKIIKDTRSPPSRLANPRDNGVGNGGTQILAQCLAYRSSVCLAIPRVPPRNPPPRRCLHVGRPELSQSHSPRKTLATTFGYIARTKVASLNGFWARSWQDAADEVCRFTFRTNQSTKQHLWEASGNIYFYWTLCGNAK